LSNVNVSVSGPALATRRATGARGGNRPRRQGLLALPSANRPSFWSCCVAPIWSPQAASMASLPPLSLSGAMPSWLVGHPHGLQRVDKRTLSEWRDAFLAAGAEALIVRQEAQLDEQGRRMKHVIAEMAMEIKQLRERIRRMEDEKPSLRWRSNR